MKHNSPRHPVYLWGSHRSQRSVVTVRHVKLSAE